MRACTLALAALLLGAAAALPTARFWHVTDAHMVASYKQGASSGLLSHCTIGWGDAKRFGTANCDTPPEVIANSMQYMASRKDLAPEFLLWTGDILPHFPIQYSKGDVQWYMDNITNHMRAAAKALGARLIPVIGNHDTFPAHQMWSKDDWVCHYAADIWKDLLSPESLKTLAKGGYYSEPLRPGLRLVVLNTVLYYTYNIVDILSRDPGDQLEWFSQVLADARNAGDYLLIVGHVPPGFTEIGTSDSKTGACDLHERYNDAIITAMEGYHDIIIGSIRGHVHTDSFRIMRNGKQSSVAFLTGPFVEWDGSDPRMRTFTYLAQKPFTLLDHTDYYYNMAEANANGRIEWKTLYNATELYDVPDLSPESMQKVVDRMHTDDSLFSKVFGWAKLIGSACDATCRKAFICAFAHARRADYDACIAA